MTNVFSLAERCLYSSEAETKLSVTAEAWRLWQVRKLDFASDSAPLPIESARFPKRPILVDPRELPKRKLTTREGRVALLHAVAHIEFTAIQLAWDHLYRFRDLPETFYQDWLGVAQEEARHFSLVRERLRELQSDYGELTAHGGLWSIAKETADDVLARMALVPRFMEARGLDVTPGMIERLAQAGDTESVAILRVILHDEVGHVALGSHWFKWICDRRQLDPEQAYFDLIERHMKGQVRGPFNLELRRDAGFSDAELSRLIRVGGVVQR